MAADAPDVRESDSTLSIARSLALVSEGEPEALLRERLAAFTRLLAGLFTVTYLAGILVILTVRPSFLFESFFVPARVANLFELVLLLSAGRVLRRRRLSLAVLQAADVAIALGVAWPMTIGLFLMPVGYVVMFGAVLVVLVVLALRAAFVPSPPRRTACIGALSAGLLVVLVYFKAEGDPTLPSWLTPALLAFAVFVWSSATTAATTVTSRVIYGLHAEVREALSLGQYTLLDKLGEGGMGRVYLARHSLLRRPTAVKLLLPDRAGPSELARFEREVQLTSRLTHPNTIAIYDYGRTTGGVFYYAMEYVDGLSLEELVREYGQQPAARVIHVLRQVAGALAEAHRDGLIHRDVKPANILLSDRGGVADLVKVVDFGLVKDVRQSEDVAVTLANSITGTPAYLAPEMITAPDGIGPAADLYALGAVGYFMLTGSLVFSGASVVEICGHHLHTLPTPPSDRASEAIPEGLERLILRCLDKEPARRPSTAAAVEEELAALSRSHPWSTLAAAEWWTERRVKRPSHAASA